MPPPSRTIACTGQMLDDERYAASMANHAALEALIAAVERLGRPRRTPADGMLAVLLQWKATA